MKNSSQTYLREVKNHIHSKEAKEFVSAELNHHITEVKKEWIKKGFNELEAEAKAVGQMGSPITLGQRLNKLYRPKVDWLTVILLIITLGLSFLPMLSLGINFSDDSMNMRYYSTHKLIFVLLGVMVAIGMMLIDFRKLEKRGWLFYVMGIFILLVLRIFPTHFINGLPLVQIGPLTMDSLMAIPFFFLAWASFFNDKRLKLWHLSILFLISSYLFLSIPSISTVYIFVVMVIVMFCCCRFSPKTILSTLGVITSLFLIMGFLFWQVSAPYQKTRILAFLNPEHFPDSEGYMILLLKDLLSNAGWFGNPMSDVIMSEAHTNLVFANLISYFGWLFGIGLVIFLSLFIVRIIVITRKIQYSYGKLLLIGAAALYTVQLITNIAMTLGYFPLITMSLPFMSYGLMPTLFNAFLIGIVLSVYRRKDLVSSSYMANEVRIK